MKTGNEAGQIENGGVVRNRSGRIEIKKSNLETEIRNEEQRWMTGDG